MKKKTALLIFLIVLLSFFQYAMARHGVYDEEAREEEQSKPQKKGLAKEITSEIKQYKVEEPAKGTDETTKIKIKIPGT